MSNTLPLRRPGLSVRAVDGEHLVLDADTAYRLAPDAAAVLDLCDGRTSVNDAAQLLALSTAAIEAATDELLAAGLAEAPGQTRRRVLQGGALAGAALVSAVVLPRAAAAASDQGGPDGGGPGGPRVYSLYSVAAGPFNNPNRSGGTAGPFSFFKGNTPAGLTALTTKFDDTSTQVPTTGVARGYKGDEVPTGAYAFPAVYVTSGGQNYTSSVSPTPEVPSGVFGLHTAPSTAAVIAFTNPSSSAATIRLYGKVIRRDAGSGGNGVHLSIVGPSSPTGATIADTGNANGSSGAFDATFTNVSPGATVYVFVDSKGDYSNDTTELDLKVSVL